MSFTPVPAFALARMAPLASSPMISSIWRFASLGLRAGQVDLVDDRNDLEAVLDTAVCIGQSRASTPCEASHQQQTRPSQA
jgi:hypothetical protein